MPGEGLSDTGKILASGKSLIKPYFNPLIVHKNSYRLQNSEEDRKNIQKYYRKF
jgi:hypothetical protein